MSPIPVKAGETLVEKAMEHVRSRIAARTLVPGAKLASIRSFAQTLGVSKSTVVEAYERLGAEGIIRARPGSGFYVVGHMPPLSLAELGPRLDRAVDPFWISRQSFETQDDFLKPGCGWLPTSWLADDAMRRTLRALARAPSERLLDYGTPMGPIALRQHLSRRMGNHGIDAPPDQIVLTASGTEAIDLVCRFHLEPGDTVLVDDPCYFNFHALLRAHRANIVGVRYTPTGPDDVAFAEAVEAHRPKLYITNSALQNPTGAILSPLVAHRILKIAEQSGLVIVEDDIFADFEHTPAPRLAAFDGLDRVIHIGSFSKTLSASVRCGFIAMRRDWIDDLVDIKIATRFGGDRLAGDLVLSLLQDGAYRRHMEALRERLAVAMSRTSANLKKIGITPWLEPTAGMFLWARLPEGLDAAVIARKALDEGIVLAPGNVFSLSQSAGGFLRFNASQSLNERLYRTLERLMETEARRRP